MTTEDEIREVSLYLARGGSPSEDDPMDLTVAACAYEQDARAIIRLIDKIRGAAPENHPRTGPGASSARLIRLTESGL